MGWAFRATSASWTSAAATGPLTRKLAAGVPRGSSWGLMRRPRWSQPPGVAVPEKPFHPLEFFADVDGVEFFIRLCALLLQH